MSNLDYFIHDGSDAFRLKIIGDLCGPGVASLDQAWRTASSLLRGRLLIVDLVSLGAADEYGRDLLLGWHRIGAKIIARSEETRMFVAAAVARFSFPALDRHTCGNCDNQYLPVDPGAHRVMTSGGGLKAW